MYMYNISLISDTLHACENVTINIIRGYARDIRVCVSCHWTVLYMYMHVGLGETWHLYVIVHACTCIYMSYSDVHVFTGTCYCTNVHVLLHLWHALVAEPPPAGPGRICSSAASVCVCPSYASSTWTQPARYSERLHLYITIMLITYVEYIHVYVHVCVLTPVYKSMHNDAYTTFSTNVNNLWRRGWEQDVYTHTCIHDCMYNVHIHLPLPSNQR